MIPLDKSDKSIITATHCYTLLHTATHCYTNIILDYYLKISSSKVDYLLNKLYQILVYNKNHSDSYTYPLKTDIFSMTQGLCISSWKCKPMNLWSHRFTNWFEAGGDCRMIIVYSNSMNVISCQYQYPKNDTST